MPTRYPGSERERRELDAFIKLMRAAGSLDSALGRYLHAHSLTSGQFGVLETLYYLGPMHQKELGKKLFFTDGCVTHVIDNLEKQELVTRVRNPEDRRFITVHLTPRGKTLIKKRFPEYLENLSRLLGDLADDELDQLGELAKKLGLAVQAHNQPEGAAAAAASS
jgi:MarR family 2-MHQ and catechol resistance regulon transcriptional repressor